MALTPVVDIIIIPDDKFVFSETYVMNKQSAHTAKLGDENIDEEEKELHLFRLSGQI